LDEEDKIYGLVGRVDGKLKDLIAHEKLGEVYVSYVMTLSAVKQRIEQQSGCRMHIPVLVSTRSKMCQFKCVATHFRGRAGMATSMEVMRYLVDLKDLEVDHMTDDRSENLKKRIFA
jgi:hypothetical protein